MVRRAEDETLKVALSLESLAPKFPGKRPRVVDIQHEAYVDHLGDDELQVFVILSDDTTTADRKWDKLHPIREVIREALREVREERFPYVRFLTRREFKETQD